MATQLNNATNDLPVESEDDEESADASQTVFTSSQSMQGNSAHELPLQSSETQPDDSHYPDSLVYNQPHIDSASEDEAQPDPPQSFESDLAAAYNNAFAVNAALNIGFSTLSKRSVAKQSVSARRKIADWGQRDPRYIPNKERREKRKERKAKEHKARANGIIRFSYVSWILFSLILQNFSRADKVHRAAAAHKESIVKGHNVQNSSNKKTTRARADQEEKSHKKHDDQVALINNSAPTLLLWDRDYDEKCASKFCTKNGRRI